MSFFRDYKYGLTVVTAQVVDTTLGPDTNFVWLAFSQNSNKVCLLKKVSAYDLSQVYYTVQVPVAAINKMVVANGNIFLAVVPEPTSAFPNSFCLMYPVLNPLTSSVFVNRPSGVDESPVDLVAGNSNVYLLTSGILSAEPAKIVSVTQSNVFNETIVLTESSILVRDASTITIDGSNNLWVATDTVPVNLIRVHKPFSMWELEETVLT